MYAYSSIFLLYWNNKILSASGGCAPWLLQFLVAYILAMEDLMIVINVVTSLAYIFLKTWWNMS